jgi:hypothetical protein
MSLIWSSEQALRVQLPVALAIVAARTREVLRGLPEPTYKYEERKGYDYTTSTRNRIYSVVEFHVVKYNISPFGGNYGKPQPSGLINSM